MSADQITPERIAEIIERIGTWRDLWEGYEDLADQIVSALSGLRAEVQRLTSWKQEAVEAQNDLQLQEIGQAIGARLGADIGPQVLPWIMAKKAEVQRLTADLAARDAAGVPELPDLTDDDYKKFGTTRPEDDLFLRVGYNYARSRLSPSPQPSADVVEDAFRAGYGKGHFDGVADHYGEPTKSVTDLFKEWNALRSSTNHDSKET